MQFKKIHLKFPVNVCKNVLLELYNLIYPRLSTGFGVQVFFANLNLLELQVRYLPLYILFSVIDRFGYIWMGSLHRNIPLIIEFLKVPFLVLYFPYYTLMIVLMMLSVIYTDDTTLYCKCGQVSDL